MLEKKTFLFAILVGLLAYYGLGNKKERGPVLQLEDGQIQGNIAYSRDGRLFYEFLGLDYAKPPVGQLRFESPEPSTKWTGIKDASAYGNMCLQFDIMSGIFTGQEDCLFLNVFTPKIEVEKKKLLKVLFFIHGGIFHFGSSNLYRPDYFIDEDIILVTINYRLGALGFLNTDSGSKNGIRGNMGLKDQVMALKWVKKNIQAFGGDPENVIIMGESAGSASVHYHMLSPMSKNLFSKAISQSGTTLNPWAIQERPRVQAKRFAKLANCTRDSDEELISCLKGLTGTEIVNVHLELANPLRENIAIFVPTIENGIRDENTFLTEHPLQLLKDGKFSKVPWIVGANKDEGLINAANLMRNSDMLDRAKDEWKEIAPKVLMLKDTNQEKNEEIIEKIKNYYFQKTDISSAEAIPHYVQMFSDRTFFVGLHKSVVLQTLQNSQSQIYLYFYTYSGEFSLLPILLAVKGKYPKLLELLYFAITSWVNKNLFGAPAPFYGVCHSDELGLQFYMPWLAKVDTTDQDYEMSKKLVKLWVNFMNDDKNMTFEGHTWEPIKRDKPFKFLEINSHSKGLIDHPYLERYMFWSSLDLY